LVMPVLHSVSDMYWYIQACIHTYIHTHIQRLSNSQIYSKFPPIQLYIKSGRPSTPLQSHLFSTDSVQY
jgi:hypothetical protein